MIELQKKFSFKIVVVILAVIIIAVAVLVFFSVSNRKKGVMVMSNTQAAGQGTRMEMRMIGRVAKSDLTKTIAATGVVSLKEEVTVYSDSQSKVSEVPVSVSDVVSEGDVLVKYDIDTASKNLKKQIAQAELDLSNQQLSLQSMALPASQTTTRQLQNSVDNAEKSIYDANTNLSNTETKIENQIEAITRAENDVAAAESELNKNKILLDAGGISPSEYDNFVTKLDTAKNALLTAQNSLKDLEAQKETNLKGIETAKKSLEYAKDNLMESGYVLNDEADIIKYKQQQNQIKQKELTLADYKDQLSSLIEATNSPMNGTITQIMVSRGKQLDTDAELLKIADFTNLIVKSNISEIDVPDLEVGQRVTMTSDGIQDVTYEGKISKIGESAVTSSSDTVVPIEISIDNLDNKLKPGFNLDIEIIVAEKKDILNAPIGAIQKDSDTQKHYVFVMEKGTLKKTDVKLGITSDMEIEILEGLNEGDMIVTSPTSNMRDGMTMEEIIQSTLGQNNQNGSSNRNIFSIFGGGNQRQMQRQSGQTTITSGGPQGGPPSDGNVRIRVEGAPPSP